MSTDVLATSLWLVLAIMLVGSSLALRRLPRGGALKLALIWGAILIGVWLAVRLITGLR